MQLSDECERAVSDVPRRVPWHETLTVRGVRHRLTWWGDRTDRPVVLLHGWMDAGDTWQFLVDCLPADWSCVAPDWRGFGGSEWQPGGYWFPDYFADLEALLEALCPHAPARIVGHSMGGNVASMYGGIRPRRLEWLINLEGMGLRRTAASQAPDRYAEWLDQVQSPLPERRYESLGQLAGLLRLRYPRLTRTRAEFLARAWSREHDGEVTLAADPRHRLVNPLLYRREEAEACWRRLEAPVLLVFGEHSEFRARLGADGSDDSFRAIFRTARIVNLPGVGHMMHHEDPQAVARHIVEFVAALV